MEVKAIRKIWRILLLVINMITGGLWLCASFGHLFDPDHFWVLGLLPMVSILLLPTLIFLMILWLFSVKKYALISLLCLLATWKPLQNLIVLRVPESIPAAKQASALRVMSWNVRHFNILEHKKYPQWKDSMIAFINQYDADVMCFQEMVASDSFPKAINYLPYFTNGLHASDFHYSYRTRLNFDRKHHFGIITLSKYPILNKKTISYPPHNYNSIFQYCDILKGGDTFRVFNVHLQTQRFNKENKEYAANPLSNEEEALENSKNIIHKLKKALLMRKQQSLHIREEIEKSPYPVIVCGDFNDVPNSYAYTTVKKDLQDAFTLKGGGVGRTFINILLPLRIDYIFCDPAFTVSQFITLSGALSDHVAVISDLIFTHKASR